MEVDRKNPEAAWKNPYVAGSPIRGEEMFFGRDNIFRWLRDHLIGRFQDNPIVLHGERRTGKTSILYQVPRRLNDPAYIPIFIDLQLLTIDSLGAFLWQVASKIVSSARRERGIRDIPRPKQDEFPDDRTAGVHFEEVFLPQVKAAIGDRRLLIMFDEFGRLRMKVESGDLPPDIFGYLRSLMANDRLSIIFSMGSKPESLGAEYGILFNQALTRQVTFLDEQDTRALITQPVAAYYDYQDEAIELIIKAASGHPFYTQNICHKIFSNRAQGERDPVGADEVLRALPDLVESTTQNLKYIWDDIGPGEQVVLAGMAAQIDEVGGRIERAQIVKVIEQHTMYPPPGTLATAFQQLRERDIVREHGKDAYAFAIELLRLWVVRDRRLDYVRQLLEQDGVLAQWRDASRPDVSRPPEPARRLRPIFAWGLAIAILLVTATGVFGWSSFQNQQRATRTSAAEIRITQTAQAIALAITDTPSATPTISPTPSATPVRPIGTPVLVIVTATPSPTPIVTPSDTPTITPTPTDTATATATPTDTPAPTPTLTPTPPVDNLADLRGKILFKTERGDRGTEFYYMNPDGSEPRPLDRPVYNLYNEAIAHERFSPNRSEQIIVRTNGQSELWRISLTGAPELRVTSHEANDYDAVWSPIDNRIVFVSERSGRTDLYILNLDIPLDPGRRLTLTDGEFDKHPSWSPDGGYVAYWVGSDEVRQIWVMDLETEEAINISNNPFRDWDPVWVK